MLYALLWILGLLTALLLVAFAAGLSARVRKWWCPGPRLVAGLLLLVSLGFTVFSVVLKIGQAAPDWRGYTSSWTLSYLVLVVLLLRWGRRGTEDGRAPLERGLAASGIGCALAFLLFATTFVVLDRRECRRIEEFHNETVERAASLLDPVPPDQDAGPELEEAFDLLQDPRNWPFSVVRMETPDFDVESARVQEILAANAEGLKRVRDALRKPRYAARRNLRDPLSYEDFTGFRTASFALQLQARAVAASTGLPAGLEPLQVLCALAQRLSQDPETMSVIMVKTMLEHIGTTLECLLASDDAALPAGFSLPPLAGISFAEKCEQVISLGEAKAGATLNELFLTEHPRPLLVDAHFLWSPFSPEMFLGMRSVYVPCYRVFMLAEDFRRMREDLYELRQIACGPYPQARARLVAIDRELRLDRESLFRHTFVIPGSSVPGQLLSGEARVRLLTVALAVSSYRAKNRKLPARLEELVPEYLKQVPPDPFDGKPLRTRSESGSLVVYSVGPDLEDGGGADEGVDRGDVAVRFGKAFLDRGRTGE